MTKLQYKKESGALHIGGGRFFYAQKPVEVAAKERDELLKLYPDLEEVNDSKEEVQKESKTKKTKE